MTFYANTNFPTKKALKEAVEAGHKIGLHAALLGTPARDGEETVSGPEGSPSGHSWYANVVMRDGLIVKVKR